MGLDFGWFVVLRLRLRLRRGEHLWRHQFFFKTPLDKLRQCSSCSIVIFVHSKKFDKAVTKLLADEELNALKEWLARQPEDGDLIRGSGGCRKTRWAAKGHGKSGGARVIYFYRDSAGIITLLRIYAKNEADNLSQAAIKQLKTEVKTNE